MNKAPDYLLLDAARMARHFDVFREKDCHYECLYEDRSRDDLASVAPYLVTIASGNDLLPWIKDNGFGNAWGVFISAAVGFETLLQHFRKFLVTKTPGTGEQYFRFYDPRVLKRFLPAATAPAIIDFFGPGEAFIAEADTKKDAIAYRHQNGVLQQDVLSADQAFSVSASI